MLMLLWSESYRLVLFYGSPLFAEACDRVFTRASDILEELTIRIGNAGCT